MTIDFKHHQSVHCESGVTTGLLGFQGMPFTEQMIFGIGSGMFFGFFPFIKINSIMVTTFRNAPGTIFKKTVSRLGVPHQVHTYSNRARAMDDLDRLLDKGIPVGLQTSLYWLPYLLPRLRNHFNAHNIIVYGKMGDEYIISEPLMDDPVTCKRADLIRARFAKGGMDPNGKMYWLTGKPDKAPDMQKAVEQGLRETCFLMLKVPVPLLGIRGVRYFASDIRRWPKRMDPELVKLNLHQFILMQEVVGSGGAGFRFMFAAFLQEAAEILKLPELNDISAGMIKVGDLWREGTLLITQYYRDRVPEKEFFDRIPKFISDCAASEEEQLKKLYAVIRKKRGQNR